MLAFGPNAIKRSHNNEGEFLDMSCLVVSASIWAKGQALEEITGVKSNEKDDMKENEKMVRTLDKEMKV